MNFREAKEFAEAPIKCSDLMYTRDTSLLNYLFTDFREFITAEVRGISEMDPDIVNSLDNRKYLSELYTLWYTCLKKLRNYGDANGWDLLVGKVSRHNYELFTRF